MANHQKSNYYGYQGENNCCPPNKIFPNDLFQPENGVNQSSANFNNDPLSGFNSMTSSYSSQADNSPNAAFEQLDGMICHGKEQGYFNNPIIVDPEQHQQQLNYYVPYTEPVYTTFEVSNTVVIENQHHQHIYYENASVGSRSYSSDQNERTSSPENYLPPPPKYSNFQNNSSRQISQDIGDILGDVDEYIRNSSSSNSPGSDQTWTPEIQYSPPPTKKQKINDNAENEKEKQEEKKIPVATTSKKERRKATNRKASANYRAKQVKSRNAKGAKKLEQEEIQKKLELDNHAIKMQIEYMMKTFSQRIKQTTTH